MSNMPGNRNRQGPSYLQFYPTLRCSAACRFCFNRGMPAMADIRLDDFAAIVSVAGKQGIGHIDMLGGEPTLHAGLHDMVRMIRDKGLRTTISTNGSRPDILETLSRTFDETTLRIGVSVNSGHVPEALDAYIRGYHPMVKSVFAGTLPIPEAAEPYAADPEIDYFILYRDAAEPEDLAGCVPFPDFYASLRRLKERYRNVDGVYCQGFVPDTIRNPALANARCPAGTTKLSVIPDGTVYPCYLFFRFPEFALGNILTDDFQTIWEHPTLAGFRGFKGNRCPETACGLFGICHGGCPAMSYLFSGKLLGPDPRCVPSRRSYGAADG